MPQERAQLWPSSPWSSDEQPHVLHEMQWKIQTLSGFVMRCLFLVKVGIREVSLFQVFYWRHVTCTSVRTHNERVKLPMTKFIC